MDELKLKAFGKINLSLDITGIRPNGYHEVEMILQSVDLFDEILLKKSKQGIILFCEGQYVPADENNLAYKAARLILEHHSIKEGVDITLKKQIPIAAGMAGGSADAAAVLTGMNQLFDLSISQEQLEKYALRLGADVPFCLRGGTALSTGIGEILTELTPVPDCVVAIAKPEFGVTTKWVYEEYDKGKPKHHPNTKDILLSIKEKDINKLAVNMYNVLEEVTGKRYQVIAQIETAMKKAGALGAMMTGSGPTVFGLFQKEETAKRAVAKVKEMNLAKQTYVTRMQSKGVEYGNGF